MGPVLSHRQNRHTRSSGPSHDTHIIPLSSEKAASQNKFKNASSPADSHRQSAASAKHTLNCSGEMAVFVFGKRRLALVDSGAIKSAISLKYYRQLPKANNFWIHRYQSIYVAPTVN